MKIFESFTTIILPIIFLVSSAIVLVLTRYGLVSPDSLWSESSIWQACLSAIWLTVGIFILFRKKKTSLGSGTNEPTILVVFSCDKKSEEMRDKLYTRMEQITSENGDYKFIKYSFLKPENLETDITTARHLREITKKSYARFIIGGHLEFQKIKNKEFFYFSYLGFSYKKSDESSNIGPNCSLFPDIPFSIKPNDDFIDVKILSEYLTTFSNCILAFSLVFSKEFLKSQQLLENLHKNSSRNRSVENKGVRLFISELRLRVAYKIIHEDYTHIILPKITKREIYPQIKKLIEMINELESSIQLSEFPTLRRAIAGLINMKAILSFALGDIKKSAELIQLSKKRCKNDIRGVTCANLNHAFLIFWESWNRQKGYELAIKQYRKILRDGIPQDTASSIKDFIEHLLKQRPERTDLLFISVLMSHFVPGDDLPWNWQEFQDRCTRTQENENLHDFCAQFVEEHHYESI